MKKLIFTAMILGLSLNGYAGKVGMTGTDCTKSVQSPRSQEATTVKDSSGSVNEQKGKADGR